jgi:steroid delta-isomerase-like uncharacterized protein
MSATDAARLHRTMFAAIESRDFPTLRVLFAPNAIHTTPDGARVSGPEPVIAEVQGFVTAFPDLALEIRDQHEAGHSCSIIEYTFSGTHEGPLDDVPPTGSRIAVDACSVLEAEDGTIRRESDYYDTLAMLTQLGVFDR